MEPEDRTRANPGGSPVHLALTPNSRGASVGEASLSSPKRLVTRSPEESLTKNSGMPGSASIGAGPRSRSIHPPAGPRGHVNRRLGEGG